MITAAQQAAITRLASELGATHHIIERDEPHDDHIFVTFFRKEGRSGEHVREAIIEADGTIDG
jgi:hypothetical protein